MTQVRSDGIVTTYNNVHRGGRREYREVLSSTIKHPVPKFMRVTPGGRSLP